jgi:hypothetical protein
MGRAFELTERDRRRDRGDTDLAIGFDPPARLREREVVESDVRPLVAIGLQIVEPLSG